MTTTIADVELVTIDLEQFHTPLEDCRELPETEYRDTFYTEPERPLSVVRLSPWRYSRVARTNANHCQGLGYEHRIIDRADWEDDLFELRSSAKWRQGRPMTPAYLQWERYGSDAWPAEHCRRHLRVVHGVVSAENKLVAYCQIVQCGEVARFNTILGHWDYLADRVVWLLVREALEWHREACRATFGLYYTHDSGHGPGLRYFKERFGFRPTRVQWRFA